MAGWRFQEGGWLRGIAVIAAAASCWASIPASAQDTSLVYEKQLELGSTAGPTEAELTVAMVPPMGLDRGDFLRLPSLIPSFDSVGERAARVIGGTPAKPGVWKSAVNLRYAFTWTDGKVYASFCGASIIDDRWVLTAAHCMFRKETGGVKDLKWVTAYADDVNIQKGTALRAKAVYVHRQYDVDWIVNDLALLELETPTTLPRQKLAAGRPFEVLKAGTMASIVGWGQTKTDDTKSVSPVLMEATIPIISKAECDAFRQGGWKKDPGGRPTEADFCAGFGFDKPPITCHGDSGGPIYVSSTSGEPLQAGVVSWGVGRPGQYCIGYGAYASVGYFEQWIKQRVPKAVFAAVGTPGTSAVPGTGSASGSLATIAGVVPGGPPSPNGQCSIDVYADGTPTNAARVGAELSVRLTAGATGRLAVFSLTSANKVVQLFPSNYGGAGAPAAVQAGDVLDIPGSSFTIKVSPPHGRYAMIAIIMPEGSALTNVAQRYADMQPIEGFSNVLARLAEDARSLPEGSQRAVCTRQFDVVE